MVSDFTTNLAKLYLCNYTQDFAVEYLKPSQRKQVAVRNVRFNYRTKSWENHVFELPWYRDDYVILCPVNVLTRTQNWINRTDLINNFEAIATSLPDRQLVAQVNSYLRRALDPEATAKERDKQRKRAIDRLLTDYPQIIDYYIRQKEDTGDEAHDLSAEEVDAAIGLFVNGISDFSKLLAKSTEFYSARESTYAETHKKVKYLKDFIEHKGGHRIFWVDRKPIRREADVQLLFKLVWYGSPSDVSSEVNDGRGPVDAKISHGSQDKTLVEFKIGSNRNLKRNLENQTEIYEKASGAEKSIKVIVFFDQGQERRVKKILKEIEIQDDPDVVLVDARADNKPSGSKA